MTFFSRQKFDDLRAPFKSHRYFRYAKWKHRFIFMAHVSKSHISGLCLTEAQIEFNTTGTHRILDAGSSLMCSELSVAISSTIKLESCALWELWTTTHQKSVLLQLIWVNSDPYEWTLIRHQLFITVFLLKICRHRNAMRTLIDANPLARLNFWSKFAILAFKRINKLHYIHQNWRNGSRFG